MMRQVAGAFMEYEKGRLVAKLRNGRERKRNETGKKVGGRKSHAELWPEVVAEARPLRRAKGKAGRLSYREISTTNAVRFASASGAGAGMTLGPRHQVNVRRDLPDRAHQRPEDERHRIVKRANLQWTIS
jgi:hypothetical protein